MYPSGHLEFHSSRLGEEEPALMIHGRTHNQNHTEAISHQHSSSQLGALVTGVSSCPFYKLRGGGYFAYPRLLEEVPARLFPRDISSNAQIAHIGKCRAGKHDGLKQD